MVAGLKTRVDGLDAAAAGRDLLSRTDDGVESGLRQIAEWQRSLILSRKTPGGGAQKLNTSEWKDRKAGLPPLYTTGRLATPDLWVVRQNRKGITVLRPPDDRVVVVNTLNKRGYDLVTSNNTPEDALEKYVQPALDKELLGFNIDQHVRKRRSK